MATSQENRTAEDIQGELNDLESGYLKCKNTLESCDRALGAAGEVNRLKNKVIEDQAKENEELKNPGFFESPLFYSILGAVVGGLAVGVSK